MLTTKNGMLAACITFIYFSREKMKKTRTLVFLHTEHIKIKGKPGKV